jgi:hypothetical protein
MEQFEEPLEKREKHCRKNEFILSPRLPFELNIPEMNNHLQECQ